jgi:hypothetical protein
MVARVSPVRSAQVVFAAGFVLGALGHAHYVWRNGLLYHHERPPWAVWFWYGLCAADLGVAALLLRRPRAGLVAGNSLMAASLTVNWFVFDSFRHGFNAIVAALTTFGGAFALCTPWLWRRSGSGP